MANNVQQYQQQQSATANHHRSNQQQQGNSSPHHCKECGINLNSAESLEVHINYSHQDNLLNKWTSQQSSTTPVGGGGGPPSEETNNNTTTKQIKREFNNTIAAPADSSDSPIMIKKSSPEYGAHRATPEMNVNFGHPPTPQSYHSASSPYQTPDNSATSFSPGFQAHFPVKTERPSSPNNHFNQQNYQSYPPQQEQQQFYSMSDGYQQQEYVHKMSGQQNNASFGGRYHPYQQLNSTHHQVSSSSPAYPPQPTPSPSPKQCDKCGYVCESATQLIEHLNVAHPPTPAPHLTGNYQQNHFIFGPNGSAENAITIKTEEADVQSEILDLDSHKVVHQVYQEEQDKKPLGSELSGHNPHSVSAMLTQWTPQQQQQQKLFPGAFPNEGKMQFEAPKVFHNPTGQQQDFIQQGMMPQDPLSYRPFEHMPPQATPPLITSTQVPNNTSVQTPPTGNGKSASWKSNEARRPKTYNCTACNKWFTSSGHLKRHYNTTLHKNAVKSSGQPDPASLPISAHHHPPRDQPTSREDHSNSPGEDSRSEDGLNSSNGSFERPGPGMAGLLQQPPAGPYDRQPPNIHHPMHSPMGNHSNTLPASPPNGEAGPSASNIDSRGLLSISSSSTTTTNNNSSNNGFNMPSTPGHMMSSMDNHHHQFQMYPNECAPHVTQVTAAITNSHSTTGEFQVIEFQSPPTSITTNQQHHHQLQQQPSIPSTQPLPSFSQFNNRYGLLVGYNVANVGGPGPVTAPFTYYAIDNNDANQLYQQEDNNYKLTVLTPMTHVGPNMDHTILGPYSPVTSKAVIDLIENQTNTLEDIKAKFEIQPASPEKAHTKRDYEESTGSPQITSTSNNNNSIIKNNNNNKAISQVSKNGLHKCYDCDKIFNKSCYLTQHNKTFHSGDKPFKCTRCGKRFSGDDQYQEHLSKHAGDKPHKCELCPKQFNHKTDLRRHMCLHTGQKPYACDTCGKGFIRKDHMLKHCETHTRNKSHSKNNNHHNNNNSANVIQARG